MRKFNAACQILYTLALRQLVLHFLTVLPTLAIHCLGAKFSPLIHFLDLFYRLQFSSNDEASD